MDASVSELRHDPLTGTPVICAPLRGERPQASAPLTEAAEELSAEAVPGCPFCPGHEAMLPEILWQQDRSAAPGWRTRAVPNKYPALQAAASEVTPPAHPLYQAASAHGHQEVIIDTPYHHYGLVRMPLVGVRSVVETYLARYRALRQRDGLIPFLFRNHGAGAGASLDHPHSQLIATPFAPPHVKREEAGAEAWHQAHGQCAYCAMVAEEVKTEDRLIAQNEAFVAFVPYAAQVPYETWICPRRHAPEFGATTTAEVAALAALLRHVARALHVHVGNPDYNLFIRTALTYPCDAPHLHWTLRIRPQTTTAAGFEASTGVRINPSRPEADAAVLRGEGGAE